MVILHYTILYINLKSPKKGLFFGKLKIVEDDMKKLIQKIEIRGYERSPDVKKSASMNTVQIKSRQHLKGEKFCLITKKL